MNILLLTYGTRGDVQPFLALGQGLKSRGHRVKLVTSVRFERFVTDQGLEFAGMPDDLLAILDTDEGKSLIEGTQNVFDTISKNIRLTRRLQPMQEDQLDACWSAAQDFAPDFVVFHPKGFAGPQIAEAFHCPALLALPFPMLVPTGDWPHIGFPRLPFGAPYNRLTHKLVNSLTALSLRGPIKAFRARHDMEDAKRYDCLHRPDGTPLPSVTAVSPSVVPTPSDWNSHHTMCGYWFPEPDTDWSPSPELSAFLNAGPAPVYIGFGSMAGKRPAALADIAVQALQKTGVRGVIATGWGGLEPGDLPESVFKLDAAPHDWLFPRMAAVVHHGGAGTTAAGLRAGVPSIITPFTGDQPYWGQMVEKLGAGPEPISQKNLTSTRLSEALTQTLGEKRFRVSARAISEKIRSEDGVAKASEMIEAMASDWPR